MTENTPKHTPGPWVCHSGMVWKADGTEDGYPIARMDRDTSQTVPTERDCNAHLIARAPDLLAEVETLRTQLSELREAAGEMMQRTKGLWEKGGSAVEQANRKRARTNLRAARARTTEEER